MNTQESTKPRSSVKKSDTWDLERIYKSEKLWEKDFKQIEGLIDGYKKFINKLGTDAATLKECLDFDTEINRKFEKLGSYAFLTHSQDIISTNGQNMVSRYHTLGANAVEASSFITPEILAIPKKKFEKLQKDPLLKKYKRVLERIIRSGKYVLNKKEERLLALQSEVSNSSSTIFRQINDGDLKFGSVKTGVGNIDLSHSTWGLFLENPDRKIRKKAFEKMFSKYGEFENSFASIYNSSIKQNVFMTKARNYNSAIERSLFKDNVPLKVYEQLIETVKDNIKVNQRYLNLVKKSLKIKELHFYDTYVPLVPSVNWKMSYDDAVKTITAAVAPLGKEYIKKLEPGLTTKRWVDRYENKGKRSGAFSSGGYDTSPYILMNYKEESLQGIYTLAHEAGHSMHTLLSAANQDFVDYDYPIFVAEVASTFNEQLLTKHLLSTVKDKNMRAYLIDREINQIRNTLIRQTMFAEFEKVSHEIVEKGEPLTKDRLKQEYKKLLQVYFGENFTIDESLTMEWARIPHFYSAFYVYKYATGLTAAIALSEKVLAKEKNAQKRYLNFLKSGASKFPLDLLKDAGIDLTDRQPVNTVMQRMNTLITELESLL